MELSLWCAAALFAGCAPAAAPNASLQLAGATMGTEYHVRLRELPPGHSAEALQADIDRLLEQVNDQMSTWRQDSELSRFNRSAAGGWFAVSQPTASVVAEAKRVHELTDGAFDVTVGTIVNLWNFGPEEHAAKRPTDAAIAQAQADVGDALLEVQTNPPALRKKRDKLYVDLSAIAKGYGVDAVAQLLDELGVADYMVEIGGEIRTRGERSPGQPWRIAIETPSYGERGIQTVLALGDTALATSGDYRNYVEVEGQRFSHTIDPRTGQPIDHTLASASVIAASCMEADALATALMVLGPDAGYNLAEQQGIAVLLLIRDGDRWVERATPAFEPYRTDAAAVGASP